MSKELHFEKTSSDYEAREVKLFTEWEKTLASFKEIGEIIDLCDRVGEADEFELGETLQDIRSTAVEWKGTNEEHDREWRLGYGKLLAKMVVWVRALEEYREKHADAFSVSDKNTAGRIDALLARAEEEAGPQLSLMRKRESIKKAIEHEVVPQDLWEKVYDIEGLSEALKKLFEYFRPTFDDRGIMDVDAMLAQCKTVVEEADRAGISELQANINEFIRKFEDGQDYAGFRTGMQRLCDVADAGSEGSSKQETREARLPDINPYTDQEGMKEAFGKILENLEKKGIEDEMLVNGLKRFLSSFHEPETESGEEDLRLGKDRETFALFFDKLQEQMHRKEGIFSDSELKKAVLPNMLAARQELQKTESLEHIKSIARQVVDTADDALARENFDWTYESTSSMSGDIESAHKCVNEISGVLRRGEADGLVDIEALRDCASALRNNNFANHYKDEEKNKNKAFSGAYHYLSRLFESEVGKRDAAMWEKLYERDVKGKEEHEHEETSVINADLEQVPTKNDAITDAAHKTQETVDAEAAREIQERAELASQAQEVLYKINMFVLKELRGKVEGEDFRRELLKDFNSKEHMNHIKENGKEGVRNVAKWLRTDLRGLKISDELLERNMEEMINNLEKLAD